MRVAILGAGFGGISAANTLRALVPGHHEVVVIDASSRFHVGAGKSWIMLGDRAYDDVSQSREALLAPGVRFVVGRVEAIEASARRVVFDGQALDFDYLIIALGADLNPPAVHGLTEGAETFYTVGGAERLRDRLGAFRGGRVVLLVPRLPIKFPPAPYEAAMLLDDCFERRGVSDAVELAVYTPEREPLGTEWASLGSFVAGELARRGIAVFPQHVTAEVDPVDRRVIFADRPEADYDLLIAVPPHEAPAVVREAGLTGPSGWIPVDPRTLAVQQPGLDGVFAIGDVTTVPSRDVSGEVIGTLPKAGVLAAGQGRAAAHQIAARILGTPAAGAFDGRGFCYIETGAGRAVRADYAFFDAPSPSAVPHDPDARQYRDKLNWATGLLAPKR
jgi:sulfide:quinone oxidoreductase